MVFDGLREMSFRMIYMPKLCDAHFFSTRQCKKIYHPNSHTHASAYAPKCAWAFPCIISDMTTALGYAPIQTYMRTCFEESMQTSRQACPQIHREARQPHREASEISGVHPWKCEGTHGYRCPWIWIPRAQPGKRRTRDYHLSPFRAAMLKSSAENFPLQW